MPFLRESPLDLTGLIAAVTSPERGGIASFLGLVRDHHGGRAVQRLEYSAYAPMAEKECAAILAEAHERWPMAQVALEHRVGALEIGDAAVAVAAAAPHRDEAFSACRYVIEEVKRRVPIWKREYYADGTVGWVDPTAPGGAVPARPEAGQAS
ncbi:MAG TPA: molybdenum cofactor biosynthesis protein MoaE [Gemmatimonadales bacterium]|nr:molybdenum cofactor biosynthesis protein MoaE [Gemmatimonadales bacterium]